ncbi:MAG: substrate-binding periplasmic protein [Vicinamibacteria bacterium]
MRWRILFVMALSLGATLGAAAESDLKVGTFIGSPPWAFIPGSGPLGVEAPATPLASEAQVKRTVGLDIDVARALGRRMGRSVTIVAGNWTTIEKELLEKRFDIVIAAWTPSRKTPEGVVASAPYYDWGLLMVVKSDDTHFHSYADLTGAKVGHFNDPAVERTLRSLGAAELVPFASEDLLFQGLKAGKVPVIVMDSPYVRWRLGRDPGFRAVGEPLNKLGYHVAVRKADVELLQKVEAAVKDFAGSPESIEIRKRWEAAAP